MALAAPASLPDKSIMSPRQTSCTAPGRVTAPVTYNIYPDTPDKSEPSTSYIDIQNLSDREEREQVVVFKGIPADAKVCTLGWIQAVTAEREFTVEENGSTKVKAFYEFPSPPDCGTDEEEEVTVNYGVIEPLSSASTALELSPDFTFWNDTPSAVNHTAGTVPCAEAIYLHVRINSINGLGDVLFKQDDKNGFVMGYNC
ncbi:uncharacterized protein B0I36DRAFT_379727 [Microdochium trichocladiopsis]|uniref:Uncharacterized protein n=1 Tax=Microdochium trichocladiopsis TaxID=1682393 RepID=A0A9P8YKU2_9PEZI|nr:uncharacterized protein B0I36DRAFT_379727 [Microdochium trichocladiopsis]KAH7040840.1 hypothetical protein B0I36DRAFT_379727 [Microdochium trichocladiopsis]